MAVLKCVWIIAKQAVTFFFFNERTTTQQLLDCVIKGAIGEKGEV